jgi:hypothetical protein
MTDDLLAHPMMHDLEATIRNVEATTICQETEIACLTLTGRDTTGIKEVLDTMTRTLVALKVHLAEIDAAAIPA